MQEVLKDWVIVGSFSCYGSFSSKFKAEEYAYYLATLGGFPCTVRHKSKVNS